MFPIHLQGALKCTGFLEKENKVIKVNNNIEKEDKDGKTFLNQDQSV